MATLTTHPTTGATPAHYSDSDSGMGGSEASHKTEEATHRQAPGFSACDEGLEEKSSLARSRLTNMKDGGLESTKPRRKSTGSILTYVPTLQRLLTANTDPNSRPLYVENLQPLRKHPHFQIQLKSNIKKTNPELSKIPAVLPGDGVSGEACVASSTNETSEASGTSLRLDDCPRPKFSLGCPVEPEQTRDSSNVSIHYSNEFFEVRRSGLSGLGAFALQDLREGQRILTEPVLFNANSFSLYDEYEKLTPSQQQAYNSLCSHCPKHATGLERIRDIYDTNSFNMGNGLCGVYLVTARFNHACRPARNVTHSFKGERQDITLRMTKDVTAGTELTLTYATCKFILYCNWGFVCSCGGCTPISQEEIASINTPPTW